MNALTMPSSMLRTKRQKYREGTESFDEKLLGVFTSKYFECNDNIKPRYSSDKQREFLQIAANSKKCREANQIKLIWTRGTGTC